MRDKGPKRQLDRQVYKTKHRRVGFSHSALHPARWALACPGVPWPRAFSSFSQPSGTARTAERKCEQGRQARQLLRTGAAAVVPGVLIYFVLRFTSIMRFHLLTASLSSINRVPLEAEPMSCWASETLACSLFLPCRPGKQREWGYRWKLFAACVCLGVGKAVAGVPALKHTSW